MLTHIKQKPSIQKTFIKDVLSDIYFIEENILNTTRSSLNAINLKEV